MSQVYGNARKILILCGVIAFTISAISWSAEAADRSARVYLFRGFMNIFSMGMDDVAASLQKRGIKATAMNHVSSGSVAAELIADYKKGFRGPIVLIGHSLGATAVVDMANTLGANGVPVTLVVSLDPISSIAATGHVHRLINLYLPEGSGVAVTRGRGFRGSLQNINVGKKDVGHVSIAQAEQIHRMLIGYVMSAVGSSRAVSKRASRPAAKKKEEEPATKPAAAPSAPTTKQGKPPEKPAARAAADKKPERSADKPQPNVTSAVNKKKLVRPATKSAAAAGRKVPFQE